MRKFRCVLVALMLALSAPAIGEEALFHDSHFHLTNYVQEGTSMADLVRMMDGTIGRSTVFGLPLAADVVLRQHRRLCADLLSAIRCAAVLLLLHRRRISRWLTGPCRLNSRRGWTP